MKPLLDLTPSIRVANYYSYNGSKIYEKHRIGYCYAFHLIDDGDGTVQIEDKTYSVSKNTMLVIPPGIPNSFTVETGRSMSAYNIYCDLWSDGMDTRFHFSFPTDDFQQQYMTTVQPCPEFDSLPRVCELHYAPELIDSFAHIVRIHNRNSPHRKPVERSLLYAWILQFYDFQQQPYFIDNRIRRIIERMEREPADSASYEKWLKQSGLQKTQFYNLFHKATGMSPKSYMTKLKMEKAYYLLLSSDLSVTEIAEELGYSSIHYFSRQFTQFFGAPPSSYRHR